MDLKQGTCIRLGPDTLDQLAIDGWDPAQVDAAAGACGQAPAEQVFQVIGVDHNGDRCWLRRWPLARHGSPVFEISLHQLQTRGHHRPLVAGRYEG